MTSQNGKIIYVGVVYRTNESYCIEGKAWKQRDHEHFTQDSTPFDKFYNSKEKAMMHVVLEHQFYVRLYVCNSVNRLYLMIPIVSFVTFLCFSTTMYTCL